MTITPKLTPKQRLAKRLAARKRKEKRAERIRIAKEKLAERQQKTWEVSLILSSQVAINLRISLQRWLQLPGNTETKLAGLAYMSQACVHTFVHAETGTTLDNAYNLAAAIGYKLDIKKA